MSKVENAKRKEEARANGVKTYSSTHVCKRGHSPSVRYVSNNMCTECASIRSKAVDKEWKRNWSREYWTKSEVRERNKRLREERIARVGIEEVRRRNREKEARLKQDSEYLARRQEYFKDYRNREEVRIKSVEKRRAYRRDPIKGPILKQKNEEYASRPEVIARRREMQAKYRKDNAAKILEQTRWRQLSQKQRTPLWADRDFIVTLYLEAKRLSEETGIKHSVDHIIPLHGDLVSGLHVEHNLRVVPHVENLRKNNKMDLSLLAELGYDVTDYINPL